MNYLVCGYLAQHYISLIQIIAIINSCNINLTLIYINSILKVRLFDVIMMSATVNFFVIAHNADISIHALAKSATFTSQSSNASILYFNPRTREEYDSLPQLRQCASFLFQSTHSQGVRLAVCLVVGYLMKFQSTHS